MTITLITGANKSLGYETARRLVDLGHTVLIGARDETRGRTAADALGARFVQLDVTDDASVAAAAADISSHEGHLDVLVNNAGIIGSHLPVAELTAADAHEVYDTNVIGIVRVTNAFVPAAAEVRGSGRRQRHQWSRVLRDRGRPRPDRIADHRAAVLVVEGGGHHADRHLRQGVPGIPDQRR